MGDAVTTTSCSSCSSVQRSHRLGARGDACIDSSGALHHVGRVLRWGGRFLAAVFFDELGVRCVRQGLQATCARKREPRNGLEW